MVLLGDQIKKEKLEEEQIDVISVRSETENADCKTESVSTSVLSDTISICGPSDRLPSNSKTAGSETRRGEGDEAEWQKLVHRPSSKRDGDDSCDDSCGDYHHGRRRSHSPCHVIDGSDDYDDTATDGKSYRKVTNFTIDQILRSDFGQKRPRLHDDSEALPPSRILSAETSQLFLSSERYHQHSHPHHSLLRHQTTLPLASVHSSFLFSPFLGFPPSSSLTLSGRFSSSLTSAFSSPASPAVSAVKAACLKPPPPPLLHPLPPHHHHHHHHHLSPPSARPRDLRRPPPLPAPALTPPPSSPEPSSSSSSSSSSPPISSPKSSLSSSSPSSVTKREAGLAPRKPKSRGDSNPDKDEKELLWPAWVYCTRYSDRPSSGPRYRKPRQNKPADKRPRTAFSTTQLQRLRSEFHECPYLSESRRISLARELGLSESQVKIWFQNKRAKLKKGCGVRNPLAQLLMKEGLYNHSTIVVRDDEDNSDSSATSAITKVDN